MSESVELSSLDLRYQGHRLRDDAREARLLASIAERGIKEPLDGVDTPDGRFLLNGFKRYRCAKKLEIQSVPYQSLSPHLPAPYCGHRRGTDQYGYVSFQGNYYWVPGSRRAEVKVLQYADRLKIYEHRTCVAEYPLPAEGIRNERFSPVGQPAPRHQPRHRQPSSQLEEKRLRAMGAEVVAYVDYVVKTPGIQRHRFLRELFAFSQQVTPRVFAQALQRALRYRVVHLPTVRRIAWLYLCQGEEHVPDAEFDENFRQRPAYQEGSLTDEPDLSSYDPTFEDPEDDGPNQPEGEDQNG